MKKTIALLLAAAMLLCACAAFADEPRVAPDGGDLIPIEEYPIVDGSTATLPLSYALMQAFTGCTYEEAHDIIRHTKTDLCFYNMGDGLNDLLLVYEPNQASLDYLKELEIEIDMRPIGQDALVFLVPSENPVTDLTSEQIYDIYTGKITEWSEIDPALNMPITAYQRPDSSGSQVMMTNLAVPADEITEAPADLYLTEMGELIEAIANYENVPGALGYSVWFYAANMYALPEVRMVSVNGIAPSAENIENKTYPYAQDFYGVIRADAAEDSYARRLFNFLLTEQGQQMVRDCGYAGVGIAEEN